MRRISLMGLALMAIFAFSAVGASVASAEETGNPEILPVPTAGTPLPIAITPNTGSKPLLETTAGAKIECNEVKGEGAFTSRRLGTALLNFTGECKVETTKCKAEGDVNGTLLLKGDIHLVDVLETFEGKTEQLRLALEVLPLAVPYVITCGLIKIEVKGSALGLVLVNNLEKTKHVDVHFDQVSLGEQFEKECILDKEFCEEKGVKKKFTLEANLGKGFELAAEVVLVLVLTPNTIEFHF
jgi:hypothetical protein